MKKMQFISAIVAVAISISSCSKKEANGPSGVKFALRATNPVSTLARPTASTIQWTSGTALPASAKFEAKKGTSEVEFTSTASQQVDLFNVSNSTFGNLSLPADTYNEIEIKIQLNGSTGSPAMELTGTFNNGTVDIPVVLQVTTPVLLKSESNNVTITSGSFTAVTSLQLSQFTTGISMNMMNSATQTNGRIVISSTSNANLYNIIVSNVDRFHHADFHH